ncbi:MAG: RecQ family ATP-dependent DNA helicase [Chloroflexi bacterium]|nr:RecQ family ATP-dependent DNA helicase [Chloroflexota bacterium]
MPLYLEDALHQHFGFSSFRTGQHEAMLAVLAQHDALVVMPTGSGKSLVYQLSALLLPGLTLVISPLIALMKDQVDALTARNIAATFINSTLLSNEQQARLAQIVQGAYKIVYVAPERLSNVAFRDALKQTRVSLLAVDEAHCISQWGHDFRPEYLRIREFVASIQRPTVTALTATATPQVQSDIIDQLGLVNATRIVTGFNRPNLALRVRCTPNEAAKYRELENILRATQGSVIVYAGTRRDAEQVAEFCNEVVKTPAAFYHAGMEDDERTRAQDDFMRGDVSIIAATNAFGMGVDKSDIRAVIHFALPSTVEAYYQEIGRAGRDGNPAYGILLYSPEDRALQEWFIENDAPEPRQVRSLFQTICRLVRTSNWISPFVLQRDSGLNDSKLQLALRQLEIAGALGRLGDAHGLIGIEVISNTNPNLTESQADTERRRAHRRRQLARMIEYAETNACRRKFILDYFGDASEPIAPDCCDNHFTTTFASARPAKAEEEWMPLVLLEIVRTLPRPVGCDKLAMIAKGSQAQEIQKFGYNKHRYYGKLADYTLTQLADIIQELLRHGLLKIIGGEYPVVALSVHGAEVLRKRIAIDLNLPALPSQEIRAEKRAMRQAGGTIERTFELAQKGLLIEQIAQSRGLAISTILGHLEQLVAAGRIEADRFIDTNARELILAAMKNWDGQWLSSLKELMPEVITYDQIRFVVAAQKARKNESASLSSESSGSSIIEFLSRAHPKPLRGPWSVGFALDFHDKFVGGKKVRTELGELVYRFKYCNEESLGEAIAERLANFIRTHPDLSDANLLLPIPSTEKERAYDPVPVLARWVSKRNYIALSETTLVKTRRTQPQKEMQVLAQKSANVAGAFRITDANQVRGRRVLLLDDLYDSGATLAEAARVVQSAGAYQVAVLTVTKTIHSD